MPKNYNKNNVYQAAIERINLVFDHFDDYFVSFSGGKDSGLMLNLVIQVAKERNRLPVPVLFYDWEAIYKETHNFVVRTLNRPEVDPTWVCLPVTERNGSSVYEPFWRPWHKKDQNLWIRDMPQYPFVVNEENIPEDWKPWYDPANHDQSFFISYADWFAKTRKSKKVANFIGIRTDESYDRYIMLKTKQNRSKFMDLDWIYRYKANKEEIYYTMPVYDFRVQDVWHAYYINNWDYNHIYDKFYRMGVSVHAQRVCNPYGEQQKRGLHQYHQCEPETWFKIVNRVSGANFGASYNKTKLTSGKITKPDNLTWKEFMNVLLESLPEDTRFHFERNFDTAIKWHQKKEQEMKIKLIFDDRDNLPDVKKNYLLTYRLMCETIIKGDYWCKKLVFQETKREKERQNKLIKKYSAL
jgi:predicted phosphoadenosine phosphosulfate sulfurtransferase